MKSGRREWKTGILLVTILCLFQIAFAKEQTDSHPEEKKAKTTLARPRSEKTLPDKLISGIDSLSFSRRFIHRIEMEVRPGYIFPTHPFLQGENAGNRLIEQSVSAHLKYALQFHHNTYADRIYGGAYQGIGFAYYDFGDRQQLGNPFAVYLFQGARILRFIPRLSFNYEWNFGLSFGWKSYDYNTNYFNKVLGSKTNAYINTNFYLNWIISRKIDLTTGIALTHFSNGNTNFPNAGLNTVECKIGLTYNFNRQESCLSKTFYKSSIPAFPRHISYDLVFFGSWRRKGVAFGDEQVASPEAYAVAGFNFTPMYNLSYKFRLGISLDGVYDGSANVYTEDYIVGTSQEFFKPSVDKQLALGLSGRAEYVMPYFTVGIGIGGNILYGKGDLNAFYQLLALKIEVTRNSFLHIGYSIQNFQDPNFLMLGFGFRFNNRTPIVHR